MNRLALVNTLTFDVFGTLFDLGSSHLPRLTRFVRSKKADLSGEDLWERWRNRQRLQQYEDNLFCAGHYGYLDSSRRALNYVLRCAGLAFDEAEVGEIMNGWWELELFPDVLDGLRRLQTKYRLIVLSNGDCKYLEQVLNSRVSFRFDAVISAEEVGAFKPSPEVYRYAARALKAEPLELMMVSAHSFDAIGARASGYRAAYVNRYNLPYDETPYMADIEASDFNDLCVSLGCGSQ